MKKVEAASQLPLLALSLSPNIGAATLERLLAYFDQDLDALLAAPADELTRVRGVGPKIAAEIHAIDLDCLVRKLGAWRDGGISLLRPGEPAYPAPLESADDRPLALFASRPLPAAAWSKAVAIVGTREPTREARCLTLTLARQLARAGWLVVSGLALGIDAAAHTGALSANGATAAVLGSGICNIYPEANRRLAARIRENGALLSEVQPHWSANAQRLVARNRIISGLCRAVIVVESAIDGGAMHTARFASEQRRAVYTFDLGASGNQALIEKGATALSRDDPLAGLLG